LGRGGHCGHSSGGSRYTCCDRPGADSSGGTRTGGGARSSRACSGTRTGGSRSSGACSCTRTATCTYSSTCCTLRLCKNLNGNSEGKNTQNCNAKHVFSKATHNNNLPDKSDFEYYVHRLDRKIPIDDVLHRLSNPTHYKKLKAKSRFDLNSSPRWRSFLNANRVKFQLRKTVGYFLDRLCLHVKKNIHEVQSRSRNPRNKISPFGRNDTITALKERLEHAGGHGRIHQDLREVLDLPEPGDPVDLLRNDNRIARFDRFEFLAKAGQFPALP
jgi:hypothetical protein